MGGIWSAFVAAGLALSLLVGGGGAPSAPGIIEGHVVYGPPAGTPFAVTGSVAQRVTAQAFTPGPASPKAPLAFTDTFSRTATASQDLGDADTGQTWTFTEQPAPPVGLDNVTLGSGKASIAVGPTNQYSNQMDWQATLDTKKATYSGPLDLLVEWTPTANDPQLTTYVGTGADSIAFVMGYGWLAPGPAKAYEGAWMSGSRCCIVQPAPAYTLGVEYSGRLEVVPGHLRIRVWQTSTNEPSTWDMDLSGVNAVDPFGFDYSQITGVTADVIELLDSDQHFGADPTYSLGSKCSIDQIVLTSI